MHFHTLQQTIICE